MVVDTDQIVPLNMSSLMIPHINDNERYHFALKTSKLGENYFMNRAGN